jgi:hypothetical protein
MKFERAEKVADAVLYEGYLLYPYRASALKNQVRWQFGVIMPREYSKGGGSEPWAMQTECLVEPSDTPVLDLRLRFLQVQARIVEKAVNPERDLYWPVESLEVDGRQLVSWDDGIKRELDHPGINITELLDAERVFPLEIPAGREVELVRDAGGEIKARIIRDRFPIAGIIRVAGEPVGSLIKLRIRIENLSVWSQHEKAKRGRVLRHALVGSHTLLALRDGAFISLLDPPEWARQAVVSCVNLHTWPVLVGEEGERDVMLSSPIILYDYPQVAPESPGEMFDATEIDEILALRTMTLTDDEKAEARATDGCAAALIDRIDALPPEVLDRLHGAVRYVRQSTAKATGEADKVPWWDPSADASVSPETDSLQIAGVTVAKGSRVRLCPGQRRADAQDMFLAGRLATVEAVFSDVDGNSHVAVTLMDDRAADLHRWHGRYLYFAPDEIEPLPAESLKTASSDSEKRSVEN